MPASYDEYFTAFADLTGGDGSEQPIYPDAPYNTADVDYWIDLFGETGIDFESHDQTIEAFEDFLISFYSQPGKSGNEWYFDREEFYEKYGISDHNIDWEAYREAIGYGR